MPLNLISAPDDRDFEQLRQNCASTMDDLEYLNKYHYPYGGKIRNLEILIPFLKSQNHCYLFSSGGKIVGFINYGNYMPGHQNSFGLVIGKKFSGQGLGTEALRLFIEHAPRCGIHEINGYCSSGNIGITRIMESNGMVRDDNFEDNNDSETVKYALNT